VARTPAVMVQGTASHVGKSVLTAAVARWLADRGVRVAPFKAQNMSLNSYVTPAGEEVARSQAAQAAALGLEPTADMNPVLLKPMGGASQVIVQGRGVGVMTAREYYAYKPHAWRAIAESYDRLAAAYGAVVLEGAGSPVEINLKEHDLVNMRMAEHANAAVVLAADIERGGVFAQIVGTWELLEPAERERVVGFIINKFRGDATLLDSGLAFVRRRTGKPVLGVLPFDADVALDEEDSLGLPAAAETAELDVAVLRLPGLSNFTDFAALARWPGVAVRYAASAADLHRPDLVILPGTRTTVRALDWLHATGLSARVRQLAADPAGPLVLGVCGGYQLLGETLRDPEAVESDDREGAGLGLLAVDTVFARPKLLRRVTASATAGLASGCPLVGYEVHQGTTVRRPGTRPWLRITGADGEAADDGALDAAGRVCGTYLHGLFDDVRFTRAVVTEMRRRKGLPPRDGDRPAPPPRTARLGAWLAGHCDLAPVWAALPPTLPA
jgi:adenosylcobyric acid synthase